MIQVLLVVQVLVATALIGIILIQRSDSDGLGLGGGSGSNFMTGRASANLLTRATAILATLFILNSLTLGVLASRGHQRSIVDMVVEQEATTPAVPSVPVAADEVKVKKSSKKEVEPATGAGKKQQ